MKIAILHSGNLKNISPGGISQYIEKLIKYNKNNEIVIYGTCDINEGLDLGSEYEREVDGGKYKFIPITNSKNRPLSIYYFITLFKYFKELMKYDIVYAQRMEYALPFTFSKIKNKLVMAVHGSGRYSYLYWGNFIGSIYNFVERLAINNSRRVIVLLNREEYGVPYYKKKFKKKEDKFVYGKVPIDLDIFKRIDKNNARRKIGLEDKDFVMLYFGRIDNNPKRVLLLPDIIKKISYENKNIKCIVIGNGEDKTKLLDLIQDKGVNEYFIIKDKLSHGNELIEYINASDISLILSNFEGICMSALESLACGVPVISTDVGDINEYIKEGKNGYIVKNGTDKEVIESVVLELNKYIEDKNIEINDKYREYEATVVIDELIQLFNNIKQSARS